MDILWKGRIVFFIYHKIDENIVTGTKMILKYLCKEGSQIVFNGNFRNIQIFIFFINLLWWGHNRFRLRCRKLRKLNLFLNFQIDIFYTCVEQSPVDLSIRQRKMKSSRQTYRFMTRYHFSANINLLSSERERGGEGSKDRTKERNIGR